MNLRYPLATSLVAVLVTTLTCSHALAHFPWLTVDDEGRAVLFFGENLSDRTYHLPKSLSDFPLQHLGADGKPTAIQLQPVSTDTMVGLRSTAAVPAAAMICGTKTYGNYHGSRLVYFAQHLLATDPSNWTTSCPLDLKAELAAAEDGIQAVIRWQAEPLRNVEVKLFNDDGHPQAAAVTDDSGVVRFDAEKLASGLNALLVGHEEPIAGTLDGQPFQVTANYLTVTFHWQGADSGDEVSKANMKSSATTPKVTIQPSNLPDLPIEVTSFGGAVADQHLYLYGGHTGTAHSYSTAEQSDQFWSLDLRKPAAWKELPSGPRLQGLALVPHRNSVIRIGGFTAKNAEGAPHDLHSQRTVSKFDPAINQWSELTPLPEPRSSFAATVLGDRVYVVGGWALSGEETQWHATAWSLDLAAANASWQALPTPGFQRRASAVAAHNDRIYVIGGMDNNDGPTTRTDIYDPKTDRWTLGPSLLGEPMNGFGCAAHSQKGRLYVSTINGDVQRLSRDGTTWEKVAQAEVGRFFHCLLPSGEDQLLLVGGANMSVGKFRNIERLDIQ